MNECMYIDRLFCSCNTVFHNGVGTYAMPQESVLGVVFEVFETEQGLNRVPLSLPCVMPIHVGGRDFSYYVSIRFQIDHDAVGKSSYPK